MLVQACAKSLACWLREESDANLEVRDDAYNLLPSLLALSGKSSSVELETLPGYLVPLLEACRSGPEGTLWSRLETKLLKSKSAIRAILQSGAAAAHDFARTCVLHSMELCDRPELWTSGFQVFNYISLLILFVRPTSSMWVHMYVNDNKVNPAGAGHQIKVKMPYILSDIPVVIVFRALGCVADRDILEKDQCSTR